MPILSLKSVYRHFLSYGDNTVSSTLFVMQCLARFWWKLLAVNTYNSETVHNLETCPNKYYADIAGVHTRRSEPGGEGVWLGR